MPGFFKVYRPFKRFDPLTLSPALWLDASDLTTLFQDRTGASASTPVANDSDPVGTWKDKSGNGYHITALSDSRRYTYKTNVGNGSKGLRGDVVDDTLTSSVLPSVIDGTAFEVTQYGVVTTRQKVGVGQSHTAFNVGKSGGYGDSWNNIFFKLNYGSQLSSGNKALILDYINTNVASSFSSRNTLYRFFMYRYDITEIELFDTSACTTFQEGFANCTKLTAIPTFNTSNVTNFSSVWYLNQSLISFPSIDTSKGTNFSACWHYNIALTSFPALSFAAATNLSGAWNSCTGLTSFPSVTFPVATNLSTAWTSCSNLVTFPSGVFDNCPCTNYTNAFTGCKLSQTSVDNILVSIAAAADALGLDSGILNMTGGTSATPSATGLAAKAVLTGRSWTVTHN